MSSDLDRRSFLGAMLFGAVSLPSEKLQTTLKQLGISLKDRKFILIADRFAAQFPEWLWSDIQRELAIESFRLSQAEPSELMANIPQLLQQHDDKLGLLMVPNVLLPELAKNGLIGQLHPDVKATPEFQAYWQGILPVFKHYSSPPYDSLPIDGDVLAFHVNQSVFPEKSPETWEELIQSLTASPGITLSQNWMTYFGLWASIYGSMSQSMNPFSSPRILEKDALKESLEIMARLTSLANLVEADVREDSLVARWIQGSDSMFLGFSSLTKGFNRFAGGRSEVANSSVFAKFPGTRQANGKIRRAPVALWGRSLAIPKFENDKDCRLASLLAYTLSKPEVSGPLVADAKNGFDPFHIDHLSERNIETYRQSGQNLMAPFNQQESIQKFLLASKQNLDDTIAQPHWPGSYGLMLKVGNRLVRSIDKNVDLVSEISALWEQHLPQ